MIHRRLSAIAVFLCLCAAAQAQNQPSPLQVVRYYNITNPTQVIDNRSVNAQSNYVSFLATGTGTWSVAIQYSDTSATGPWTVYGSGATVTNANNPTIGFGYGYHKWISFAITGTVTIAYAGCKDFFIAPGGGGGGGISFPILINQGGTSATTATQATINLQYQGTAVGSVPVSDAKKLGDWVSATDFGVVGDCVTDDTTALQSALNTAAYLVIPAPVGGCYLISSTLTQQRGSYVYGISSNLPANAPTSTPKGVTIRMAPGRNLPVWQTWDGANAGTGNEFYGLENVVIDGNGQNQTSELAPNTKACLDYRGTFVLAKVNRVEVTNCFGTAMFNTGAEVDNTWLINNTTSTYAYIHNPGSAPGFGGMNYSQFFVEESMRPKSGGFNDAYSGGAINDPTQYAHAILLNGVQANMNYVHCEAAETCIDFYQSQGLSINNIQGTRIGNPADSDPTNQYLIRQMDLNSENYTFTAAYMDQSGSTFPGSYGTTRIFGLANGLTSSDIYQTPQGVSIWPFYTWGRIDQAYTHAPYLGERPVVGNELWLQGIGSYSPNAIRFFGSGATGDANGPDWFTTGQAFLHETSRYQNQQTFLSLGFFNPTDNSQNTISIPGPSLILSNATGANNSIIQTDNTNGNLKISGNPGNFLYYTPNAYFGLTQGSNQAGNGSNFQGLSSHPYYFRGAVSDNIIYDAVNSVWDIGTNGNGTSDAASIVWVNGGSSCIFSANTLTPGSTMTNATFLADLSNCTTPAHDVVIRPAFTGGINGFQVIDDGNALQVNGTSESVYFKLTSTTAFSCTNGARGLLSLAESTSDQLVFCGQFGSAPASGIVAWSNQSNTFAGVQDFSAASVTKPFTVVTSAPSGSCSNASSFVTNSSGSGANLYQCIGGAWASITGGGGGGGGVTSVGATAPVVSSGGAAPTISVLTGTTSGTLALGNDARFLNATSLNGTLITGLTGIMKLTSGTPSNAAAADVIALFNGGSCSGYLKSDGTCSTPVTGISQLTGDVTTISGSGSQPATLATVNSGAGTCGDATHVCRIATDVKGRILTQTAVGITGGGGGGGAGYAQQLTDFQPVSIGGVSMTFGTTNPTMAKLNGTQYPFSAAATVTVSGTNGDHIWFYLNGAGQRTLGVNSGNTYTLTGFENTTAVAGITAFPAVSLPLFDCSYSGTAFTSCNDDRPWLSQSSLVAGPGTDISNSASGAQVGVAWHTDPQSSTTYVINQTDQHQLVTYTGTATGNWVLPQANTPGSGNFQDGFSFIAYAKVGNLNITPNVSTVNGATTLAISAGSAYFFHSDGTNYQAFAFGGGGGGAFNGGTITTPLTISTAGGAASLNIASTSGTGYTVEQWTNGGTGANNFQIGSGGPLVAAPYTNKAYFDYGTSTFSLSATMDLTNGNWDFTKTTTFDGPIVMNGTCTGVGCGSGGGGGLASVTSDTNVTGTLSAGNTLLTLGWTGTLAKSRQLSTAVFTDQGNAFGSGTTQDFSAAQMKLPVAAGYAPTASGLDGINSTNNSMVTGLNGSTAIHGYYTGTQPTSGNCVSWGANPGQLTDSSGTCGGGGGATSFSGITAGTNAAALVVGTGGSLAPSGTGTITATNAMVVSPPYLCNYAGTTCYDQADSMFAVTKPTTPTWLNSVSPSTSAAGPNGNLYLSNAGSGAIFGSFTASTSAEAAFNWNTIGATSNATVGVWVWDSTNSKIYICGDETLTAGLATPYTVYVTSVFTYAGTGNPAFSTYTAGPNAVQGHQHMKASVSGGTLSCQASVDGGAHFFTYSTTAVGTITKGGPFLNNSAMNVTSLNVQ